MSGTGDGGIGLGQITPYNFPYNQSYNSNREGWNKQFGTFKGYYPELIIRLERGASYGQENADLLNKIIRGVCWDWRANIRLAKGMLLSKNEKIDDVEDDERARYNSDVILKQINEFRASQKPPLPPLLGLVFGRKFVHVSLAPGSDWNWVSNPNSIFTAYQIHAARWYNGAAKYNEFGINIMNYKNKKIPVIAYEIQGLGFVNYIHNSKKFTGKNPAYTKLVYYPNPSNPFN